MAGQKPPAASAMRVVAEMRNDRVAPGAQLRARYSSCLGHVRLPATSSSQGGCGLPDRQPAVARYVGAFRDYDLGSILARTEDGDDPSSSRELASQNLHALEVPAVIIPAYCDRTSSLIGRIEHFQRFDFEHIFGEVGNLLLEARPFVEEFLREAGQVRRVG
jgi:hypothetical protein